MLSESAADSAAIWIIGEYSNSIPDAYELLLKKS